MYRSKPQIALPSTKRIHHEKRAMPSVHINSWCRRRAVCEGDPHRPMLWVLPVDEVHETLGIGTRAVQVQLVERAEAICNVGSPLQAC